MNGAADRVAVIGVESERETITDQAPNRSSLGDVAGYVADRPGAVIVKADPMGLCAQRRYLLNQSSVLCQASFAATSS